MVRAMGLEPIHPKVRDFKSLASTHSAMPAHQDVILGVMQDDKLIVLRDDELMLRERMILA